VGRERIHANQQVEGHQLGSLLQNVIDDRDLCRRATPCREARPPLQYPEFYPIQPGQLFQQLGRYGARCIPTSRLPHQPDAWARPPLSRCRSWIDMDVRNVCRKSGQGGAQGVRQLHDLDLHRALGFIRARIELQHSVDSFDRAQQRQ
jgi:hypothetical protein